MPNRYPCLAGVNVLWCPRDTLQESSNDDYKEDLQAVVRAASNQAAAFSSAVSTGAAGAAKLFRSWSSSFDERMKRVNNEDT